MFLGADGADTALALEASAAGLLGEAAGENGRVIIFDNGKQTPYGLNGDSFAPSELRTQVLLLANVRR